MLINLFFEIKRDTYGTKNWNVLLSSLNYNILYFIPLYSSSLDNA